MINPFKNLKRKQQLDIGDDNLKSLIVVQDNYLDIQDKLKALFSAEISKEDPFPVNARELHDFLGIATQFSKWIQRMIDYGFVKDKDYVMVVKNVYREDGRKMAQEQTDYMLSLNMAQHIAMVQRTDLGMIVREYLLWAEKKLREIIAQRDKNVSIPLTEMSTLAKFKMVLQIEEEHEQKITALQQETSDIKAVQTKQGQALESLEAVKEEHDIRLTNLENQNTVTIKVFAPPDDSIKDQINKRVKALAFNRKEKEGGLVGTHISDIWTDIYRQLRNMSYDIDEELACFKDFWTSQKNRGNKMFTQGKINGFKNLDVISAVPDIRSAVRNILDIMFEETEENIS